MLTFSNILSFSRIPLSLLFFTESTSLRLLAVVLAMFTDSMDGYLARRSKTVSRFGAILDPTADKLFVYVALATLVFEEKLLLWQALAMISRDVALLTFALFMLLTGQIKNLVLRSIRMGKIATAFQFIILILLLLKISFSWITYSSFIAMGGLALIELYDGRRTAPT
jgi:phosphatidylglycerophosphate synthase